MTDKELKKLQALEKNKYRKKYGLYLIEGKRTVETALECKAKHLALTHYSARLEHLEDSIEEAQVIHDSVVACNDGDRLLLEDDGNLVHLQKSPEGWLTL